MTGVWLNGSAPGCGMNTSSVQIQSPGPVGVAARRLQFVSTVSFAPGATVRPSSRCWRIVRLLNEGLMLAFSLAAVSPAGPQLLAMARNATSAADPTATRTGTTQPGRRLTAVPA